MIRRILKVYEPPAEIGAEASPHREVSLSCGHWVSTYLSREYLAKLDTLDCPQCHPEVKVLKK